jgi:hypothetical protein
VVEVAQKGYRLQDRLVRPAMVRVGTGGEATAGGAEPETANEAQETKDE